MQMKRRALALIICLSLLGLYIGGCAIMEVPSPIPLEQPEVDEIEEDPITAPVQGGTISTALPQPDSFNPLLTRSRDTANLLSLVCESAVSYDRNLRPQPALAERWEAAEEGTLWLFHARRDVKWHDGEAFTAEDILFTYELMRSGQLDAYYQFPIADAHDNILEYGLYNGDPHIFYLRLAIPSALVPDWMTFPVISRRQYRTLEWTLEHRRDLGVLPVGTGPYRFHEEGLVEGQLQLVRNENWWQPPPYLDAIVARIYGSNEEARNAFLAREVDLVDTTAVYASGYTTPGETNLVRVLTQSYEFLALNSRHPALADTAVRQAMAYAIDRKEMISKIYLNHAEAVDVPLLSNSWLYDSALRIYDYDLERAMRLLTEAGWEAGADGVRVKETEGGSIRLSFTILTNEDNDLRRESALLMVRHLALAGFEVKIKTVPWDVLREDHMDTGQFDVILTGFYLDYAHDLSFAFHSKRAANQGNNFIVAANEELDTLLTAARQAYGPQERREIYREIQRHLIQEMPVISLYFRTGALLADNRIRGIDRPMDIALYRNIQDWYVVE